MKLSDLTPVDATICVVAGLALTVSVVGLGSMTYKASYCQTLTEQHIQHRNAAAAMSAELDREFPQSGFSYERGSVALSNAMYNSLKRDNGCS